MEPLQYLIAVVPGLLIVLFIYHSDRYEKEQILPLFLSYLLGILITVPVYLIQAWYSQHNVESYLTIPATLFSSFVLVALSEELFKFAALMLYPYRRRFFNEPIDGIVYAVVIAMGFATVENILYAFRYGLHTVLLRALTAVPAHACFGVLMGYYVGKARFVAAERRLRYLIYGVILAIGIHGLYDFFILQQIYDGLILLAMLTLALSLFFALRLLREQQEDSPFK